MTVISDEFTVIFCIILICGLVCCLYLPLNVLKSKNKNMTPEGLLTIKQLLTHPCGVGPTWTNKLLEELIDAIVCVQEEKEEDKNG